MEGESNILGVIRALKLIYDNINESHFKWLYTHRQTHSLQNEPDLPIQISYCYSLARTIPITHYVHAFEHSIHIFQVGKVPCREWASELPRFFRSKSVVLVANCDNVFQAYFNHFNGCGECEVIKSDEG